VCCYLVLGSALRKAVRSRKVDKCGTVLAYSNVQKG
jgi:hypothetical protein